MTLTMMVLGFIAMGVSGFILGQHRAGTAASNKIKEVKFKVDAVIRLLQLKLITENDHRGFHTRTQVSEWLKRVGPDIHEEFHSGANHGRKTL
jgi:F420-0:gamma-glutamyl ligase-like protein